MNAALYSVVRATPAALERAQANGLEIEIKPCADCGADCLVHPPAFAQAKAFSEQLGEPLRIRCNPCFERLGVG